MEQVVTHNTGDEVEGHYQVDDEEDRTGRHLSVCLHHHVRITEDQTAKKFDSCSQKIESYSKKMNHSIKKLNHALKK